MRSMESCNKIDEEHTLTRECNFLERYCNQGLYPKLPVKIAYGNHVDLLAYKAALSPDQNFTDDNSVDIFNRVDIPYSNIRYDIDLKYVEYTDCNKDTTLTKDTTLAMEQSACLVSRELNRQIWSGNGSFREMYGLDIQLKGELPRKTPEINQQLVGVITDFKGKSIYSDFSNSKGIDGWLLSLRRHLYYRADLSRMLPATWVIAMSPRTWECLASVITGITDFIPGRSNTTIWECSYCGRDRAVNLTQCLGGCGATRKPTNNQYICLYCGRVYQNDKDICWDTESGTGCGAIGATVRVNDIDGLLKVVNGDSNLFDWMLEECKIPLDGFLYDVILDNGIIVNGGLSSIYFIPMTICGNIPVTYLSEPVYDDRASLLPNTCFTTDNGRLLWQLDRDMYDQMLRVKTAQRVVMRTPQLGGVIENIRIYDQVP